MNQRRGTVDQLPSGRWRLRLSVDGKQRPFGTYATKADAWRAAEVASEVEEDTRLDVDGDSVEEFARKLLTRREVKREVRDPDKDWSRYRTHIKGDPLGAMGMRRVQPVHLHRWMKRIEAKDPAASTMRACRSLISVICAEAIREGLLKSNPARELRITGGRKALPWTFLVPTEQTAMVQAADGAPAKHLVATSIGAGLRAGELVTLRLADVTLDGPEPHIVVRYGTPPSLPTKTGAIRVVPLFGIALAALRDWLTRLPDYCKKNKHGLVFPRQRGGFRSPEHVLRWDEWKLILETVSLGRAFRWHDLRHTCASSLVSGFWGRRWSLQEVKEMLGHTSIQVTQRYAHLAKSAITEAARETQALVTSSHAAGVIDGVGESHEVPKKQAPKLLAPPARVERATNALGRPGFSSSSAAFVARDLSVTKRAKRLRKTGARDLEIVARLEAGVALALDRNEAASTENLAALAGLLFSSPTPAGGMRGAS